MKKAIFSLGFLRNIFRRTAQPAPWIIAVAVLAAFLLVASIAVFFYEVNSTLSDATWGDIAHYNQIAYNFTHGRPLQTSVYRSCAGALWSNNPFPYLHSFNIHVNFTPYLFLWPYKFMPNVNAVYLITILSNVIGFLGIGWLIMRRLSTSKDRFTLYALACSLFFLALPFTRVVFYKGQYMLFGGPLAIAAYYFYLRRNRFMLLISGLLLCGVDEGMPLFVFSFSAYLFIFEKEMRRTALLMGITSLVYTVLAYFVIQPACEVGMPIIYANDLVGRLKLHVTGRFGHTENGFIQCTLIFMRIAVALAVMALFSGFKKGADWKRPIGLIVAAPASHWLLYLTEMGQHHPIPVLACIFLAFLVIASKLELYPVTSVRMAAAVFICSALFLANVYLLVKNSPDYSDAKSIARMETNKAVLRVISALPKDAGISYWTNQGIDAFITSRNDVWRFPEYYDLADYLVIQKDADHTFYRLKEDASGTIEAAIKGGKWYSSDSWISVPAEAVSRIEHELVDAKASHEVVEDNPHMLILKRKEKANLPCPEFTIGLNWVKNIGKKNVVVRKDAPDL